MLRLQNISKKYTTGTLVQTALNEVSLTFRRNEFVAVLGPSGSGKTTLLNVVGGLDRYDSGDLVIRGISTKKYRERDWDSYRNHTIGFVFQSYNLIPHQSVLANVELALTISGISRKERRARAKQALEKVGLGDQLHKRPNQMSGGQMQRVAIARALVNNPDVVLADEPTGALDSETSVQVMALLKEVAQDRLVIMVTHNGELAEEYATRIVRLKDGRITADTSPYDEEAEAADEGLTQEAVQSRVTEGEPGSAVQSRVTEGELGSAVQNRVTGSGQIPAGQDTAGKAAQKAGGSAAAVRKKGAAGRRGNMGRSSMSPATSLSLSFNNLQTKLARTVLTAFAGSIGIIGIALILSLSTGVDRYIDKIQKDTMTSYPITIDEQTIDLEGIMNAGRERSLETPDHGKDAVYADTYMFDMASSLTTSISENNLTAFKHYLDDEKSPVHQYIGETGILYSYRLSFDIYAFDTEGTLVDANNIYIRSTGNRAGQRSGMSGLMRQQGTFAEMLGGNGEPVSQVVKDSYELVYGHWPASWDELVLVLDENNELSMTRLYAFGFLPFSEYEEKMASLQRIESFENEEVAISYEDVCAKEFYLIPECDKYFQREDGSWNKISGGSAQLAELTKTAIPLKISAIVRRTSRDSGGLILGSVGYTQALTSYLMKYTDESPVVKAQESTPEINILTGYAFTEADDEAKAAAAKDYLENMGTSEKAEMVREYIQTAYGGMGSFFPGAEGQQGDENSPEGGEDSQNEGTPSGMMNMTDEQLAFFFDQYLKRSPDQKMMLDVYDAYLSGGSYEENLKNFGVVEEDAPTSISIYADSFEDKDGISSCIEEYNKTASEKDQIVYTDYVGLLMSSVTSIINTISYVLIAFVSVSLVVSSIMIGIITYISVLERTKEIGILRAIGASRRNISQVFTAETFIIGLLAGLMGVGVTALMLLPINAVIHRIAENTDVNAILPWQAAIVLVLLSMFLTMIGGFLPSKKAARMDPVKALRTE